jgi:hypothetical protein
LQKVDDSTLWAEIASLAGELGLLDKQLFIETFTKRAKKAGDDKKKSALPQDDIVSFLKPNRARNFCKYLLLKSSLLAEHISLFCFWKHIPETSFRFKLILFVI